jgi:DNA polymerase III subunit gamma/tau
MNYLSLYRKWRSQRFEDVLGQPHVTETLQGALRDGRLHHAYLFSGPRGTGKTSTARILAKALNCEQGMTADPCGKCSRCLEIAEGSSLDVFEMDAASHTSVDDVREIREKIPFASAGGGHKVYIIDEAHQLSTPAFNALLKMLEEPPGHVVFVLCTTESHKLPATVISRCQRFEFRRLSSELLAEHLTRVSAEEGIKSDDLALALIARHAKGSARDALSLLDQAAGTSTGHVTRQVVTEILGEAPEDALLELAEAIASEDIPAVFSTVERTMEQGWDPRQLLRQLLEEFRALFLVSKGAAAPDDVDPEHAKRRASLAGKFVPAHLEWVLVALAEAQADMRLSTHPRLTLEVALARASNLEVRETQTIVARLERLERLLVSGESAPPAPAAPARPAPRAAEPQAKRAPAGSGAPEPVAVEPSEAKPVRKQPAAAAPPPADAGLEERWTHFLERVKTRKRTTHALVKEGWPIRIEKGQLVVGFERKFHAEAIAAPSHLEHLNPALEEAFGEKLRLRPEISPGERPGRTGDVVPASADAEESPVDLVKRGLSAEVVEEVKP